MPPGKASPTPGPEGTRVAVHTPRPEPEEEEGAKVTGRREEAGKSLIVPVVFGGLGCLVVIVLVGAGAAAVVFLRRKSQQVSCPKCGAANQPGAKFCEKCGEPLVEVTEE